MKTIRTTCPYCGVGCGVLASVDDAGQVSVRGDDQHPANLGRLCVKGAALGETTGLAGRLLTPEVDGQQVAWPQALAETAARLRQIIDQHGPQAVAFYASGQLLTEDYYAANKLMKGFIGAANIDTNSRLCMSSAVTGYKRAFGADVVPCSYDDVENSDLVVLVGSNAAWAHPVLFQRLAQAKRDNPRLRIVAIDPRRTATCEIADRHLALAPGSDGGLFVGLLNALARQEPASMAFATARRRWPPPAAGTWRGWRPFAVCLPMRWRDSIASSSPPRGRSPSTPWESINPPAAATNVTPSSTSIWPAGSMAAAAAAPFR